MKKNKLVLASGIIMLVGAVLSLFLAIYTGITLSTVLDTFFNTPIEEGIEFNSDSFLLLTIWFSYIISVIIYLAESVLYIIFGIKLIVKASKCVPLEKYKSVAIAMQIVCYVIAGLSISGDYISGGLNFALALASGILLSVALAQNKKDYEKSLTSSYGSFKDDVGRVNLEDIPNVKNAKKPFNEKMFADDLNGKLESIKALKESGVIDENEYIKMVHKVLGLEENGENASSNMTKKSSVKKDKENENK